MIKWTEVKTKLKAEWKTFVLAVAATVAGAVQAGAELGLQVPDLFNWLPDKIKPYVLFMFGLSLLALRRYRPVEDVSKSTSEETSTVKTPGTDDDQ